jgi:hypothetical protein
VDVKVLSKRFGVDETGGQSFILHFFPS